MDKSIRKTNIVLLPKIIVVEGVKIDKFYYHEAVFRHFEKPIDALMYISLTLDGKKIKPFSEDSKGRIYKTVSSTSSIVPVFAESEYRDSCFRIIEEECALYYFHLCHIKNRNRYLKKKKEIE